MPSIHTTLIPLLAAMGPALVSAEHLRVVFSNGAFSSIANNDAGDAIYDDGTPKDHSPCFHQEGGRTFTIGGDCWTTTRTFNCEAAFDGSPDNCAVSDENGNVLGSGVGQESTTFIGIAIGVDASCVVEFDSDDSGDGCPVDDGNGPLHVTSG
ncbi:hypothetical protein BJX70DRAFT_403619 [Aspergillus crustosus]